MKDLSNLVEEPQRVLFESLFLDPNNPRIAPATPPGYNNPEALTSDDIQRKLALLISDKYDVKSLEEAIRGQGWIPMDAIVVWTHPDKPDCNVVLEGNRRTTTLRHIRKIVRPKERKKLDDMIARPRGYSKDEMDAQARKVKRLDEIIEDTNLIRVFPVKAKTVEELLNVIPRLMGVRHLAGVKEWEPYARALYVFERYQTLFGEDYPEQQLAIKSDLVKKVAAEVSLGETMTKRMVQASYAFSAFRSEYTDELPAGEQFEDTDYYLFELITKKPFLRKKFGLEDDGLQLSGAGHRALFAWVFAKERPVKADDSDNIFYRHENVLIWDQMTRYDEEQDKLKRPTNFALRFNVDEPEKAPPMRLVEAEWRTHQAQQSPVSLIERLVEEFGKLPVHELTDRAEFLTPQLDKLEKMVKRFQSILKAAVE